MDNFSIQHKDNGNVTVVTISGRVDSVTAATMDMELGKIVQEHKKIVLDLKIRLYWPAAGERVMKKTSQRGQKSGGGIKMGRIPDTVMEVLENVGMMEVLKSYPSVDMAVASF